VVVRPEQRPKGLPGWRRPTRIEITPTEGGPDTMGVPAEVRRAGAMGLGSSLLVHSLVLAALSVLVLDSLREQRPLSTQWGQAIEEAPSLPESVSGDLELARVAPQEAASRMDTVLLDAPSDVLERSLEKAVLDYVDPTEMQAAENPAAEYVTAPPGAKVVTKGSFSVWTVPKDPKPEQEYRIVIQIRLPKIVRRYRATDLTGEVRGTDSYRQQIPWDPRWVGRTDVALTVRDGKLVGLRKGDFLPVVNRVTQLVVRVPPARRLVRDRIRIRSRLLKEEQELEIVF